MVSEGASFLPRIQSIFYAVLDVRQGPKIVCQVPEGLISVPHFGVGLGSSQSGWPSTASSTVPPTPSTESDNGTGTPDHSSTTFVTSPLGSRSARSVHSPSKRPSSSTRTLFNFEDISGFVIPRSELCGRLVICATRNYKIIGFPVNLLGNYLRNYFKYNLCFVFERSADLSCYEPIVRKVSRVLTAREEESAFLSSPQSATNVHAILEQMYEDLNSYSETSISIDNFNSIDLKIFPFYPNPPEVKDWAVPIAIITIPNKIEDNWDLTMAKVCRFLDGMNHVSRIAHLADCDLDLTRQAISHLLYYQVIMMIDIFQYSNVYTLRKNIQWLADEAAVKEECGNYITKPGRGMPDWPRLLHWYSRLKPGKTVLEWIEEHDVSDAIDVRRFTSFGVIKGFLRRVHRWPILVPTEPAHTNGTSMGRKRGKSTSGPSMLLDPALPQPESPQQMRFHTRHHTPPGITFGANLPANEVPDQDARSMNTPPARRSSVAETVLERLHNLDLQQSGSRGIARSPRARPASVETRESTDTRKHPSHGHAYSALFGNTTTTSTPAPVRGGQLPASAHIAPSPIPARSRPSRSPSVGTPSQSHALGAHALSLHAIPPVPPEFVSLLDGEHHTDELATRFEVGWPVLQRWLAIVGGGKGEDFGRVSIIYR